MLKQAICPECQNVRPVTLEKRDYRFRVEDEEVVAPQIPLLVCTECGEIAAIPGTSSVLLRGAVEKHWRIEWVPNRTEGMPVITGTQISPYRVAEKHLAEEPIEALQAEFPALNIEQLRGALQYCEKYRMADESMALRRLIGQAEQQAD